LSIVAKKKVLFIVSYYAQQDAKPYNKNNNQFARELKKLIIKGCYYSIQEYLNNEFSNIG
jgi:hypothetical protein